MIDQEIVEQYSAFVNRMCAFDSVADIDYAGIPNILRQIHRNASGMSVEVAELLEITHKSVYRGHEWEIADMVEELGDVLFYLQKACNVIGISIDELMSINMRKLSARYPDGYNYAQDVDRDD